MSFERSGGGGIAALASGEMAAITPVVPSALNLAMGTRQVTVPLAFLPGPSLAPPLHLATALIREMAPSVWAGRYRFPTSAARPFAKTDPPTVKPRSYSS